MTMMTRGGKSERGREDSLERRRIRRRRRGSSRRRRRLYYEGRRETFIILFRWSEAGNLVL